MSIPKEQLKSWAKQGEVNRSKRTYELIKKSLSLCNEKYCNGRLHYDIYLSGSYKNSTNIDDSDIDVIVQLNSIYLSNNKEDLKSTTQNNAYNIWNEFHQCIVDIAEEEFGFENVIIGNKSIKVETDEDLSHIDIVPCIQYRNYNEDGDCKTGFTMWHREKGYQIIHYPKRHYYNGIEKQKFTNNSFKSTVRIFKNIRHYLVEQNVIEKENSSSYFLECLLYNVPNEIYSKPNQEIIPGVLEYLNKSNIEKFKHQHNDEYYGLFGNHPEQWDVDKAVNILNEINSFFKNH